MVIKKTHYSQFYFLLLCSNFPLRVETLLNIRQPLRLHLGFSHCLLILLSFTHIGAAVCVALTPLPWGMCWLLWLAISGHFWHSVQRHLLWRKRRLPRELVLQHHQLYLDDEQVAAIEDSRVQPWFVLIYLRLPNGRSDHLLICADSVAADSFRHLRVRLKYPQQRVM